MITHLFVVYDKRDTNKDDRKFISVYGISEPVIDGYSRYGVKFLLYEDCGTWVWKEAENFEPVIDNSILGESIVNKPTYHCKGPKIDLGDVWIDE